MYSKKAETIRSIIKTQTEQKRKSALSYTFACECGKKYTSYPALYLHFKRSHHIKINTKISGDASQTTLNQNERVFTYYYSGADKQSDDSNDDSSKGKKQNHQIIQDFIKQNNSLCAFEEVDIWLIWDFTNFAKGAHLYQNNQDSQVFLDQLPHYFNSYIIYNELFLREYSIYKRACLILIRLGKWLKMKKMTEYIVIGEDFLYNQP